MGDTLLGWDFDGFFLDTVLATLFFTILSYPIVRICYPIVRVCYSIVRVSYPIVRESYNVFPFINLFIVRVSCASCICNSLGRHETFQCLYG